MAIQAPQPHPVIRHIDQREALRSLIRVWLATRDQLLWVFVSGVDGEPIAEIKLDNPKVAGLVSRANTFRAWIEDQAKSIAEVESLACPVESVIEDAVREVLADGRPKFLLDLGTGTF